MPGKGHLAAPDVAGLMSQIVFGEFPDLHHSAADRCVVAEQLRQVMQFSVPTEQAQGCFEEGLV